MGNWRSRPGLSPALLGYVVGGLSSYHFCNIITFHESSGLVAASCRSTTNLYLFTFFLCVVHASGEYDDVRDSKSFHRSCVCTCTSAAYVHGVGQWDCERTRVLRPPAPEYPDYLGDVQTCGPLGPARSNGFFFWDEWVAVSRFSFRVSTCDLRRFWPVHKEVVIFPGR